MDVYAKESYEPSKPQSATRLSDAVTPTHNVMEGASNPYQHSTRGTAKGINQATKKAGENHDKTTEKMRDSYANVRSYSHEKPGRLIFIALGIGVGVGLLLGANSHHHSRAGRMVQPVADALSDIAAEFFR